MIKRTVISLEQALSLPSATLRFAQLGWRVIRIESTPRGDDYPGDPNRYTGAQFLEHDRRAFFVAPNAGKESVALNLKDPEGRKILHGMIEQLNADIFCCNTLPARYKDLGIDYETLSSIKPDIIWAGISAMGPDYPNTAGYDPVLQAMSGIMALTGEAGGQPYMCGVPLTDLKAGDEVYANVALALAERAETGRGQRIDVSMLQAAASWLICHLPLLNFDPEPSAITRSGNQDRFFLPTDIFKTKDGYIYLAIGNDIQWKRLVSLKKFAQAATEVRSTNSGRHQDRKSMYEDLHGITCEYFTAELVGELQQAGIPCSVVNTVNDVAKHEAIKPKLTMSSLPNGKAIHMQPPAVDREGLHRKLSLCPRYGEHTDKVLEELGYCREDIAQLKRNSIVSSPV
jgi:crotonobetainyl-CoA:carnitine CoA-transferase CaiB-like acyl-CoA transferase